MSLRHYIFYIHGELCLQKVLSFMCIVKKMFCGKGGMLMLLLWAGYVLILLDVSVMRICDIRIGVKGALALYVFFPWV